LYYQIIVKLQKQAITFIDCFLAIYTDMVLTVSYMAYLNQYKA